MIALVGGKSFLRMVTHPLPFPSIPMAWLSFPFWKGQLELATVNEMPSVSLSVCAIQRRTQHCEQNEPYCKHFSLWKGLLELCFIVMLSFPSREGQL